MRKRTGFTLIELLVVMAIIAILAGLIFPVFAAAKEKGRRSKCMHNLKQIGVAFELYCQDYDTEYVAPVYLGRLYPRYVTASAVYVCPSDPGVYNGKRGTNGTIGWEQMKGIPTGTSYVYYPLVGPEWYRWPEMYEYGWADLPVAACHIHHLNDWAEQAPILILTKGTSVAKTDVWWKVRRGPKYWR